MCSKGIEDNWNIYKNKYEEFIEAFVPHKLVKAGQRMKLPWTRYKSVKKKAKSTHRATVISAWKSGLHADKVISENVKRDTDTARLKAKAHCENKIVEQSTEIPRGSGTTQGITRNLPAP